MLFHGYDAILQASFVNISGPGTYGKMFSQSRSNFPCTGTAGGRWGDQGVGELEAYQMISVGVVHPQSSGSQIAGRLGQGACDRQRRAGNLQQNLLGERQRAAYSDQGAAGGDVERGGKLQEFLAFFVTAAYKNRDGDGKPRPLAALCFLTGTLQTDPFLNPR
jgi:hypothetical protein